MRRPAGGIAAHAGGRAAARGATARGAVRLGLFACVCLAWGCAPHPPAVGTAPPGAVPPSSQAAARRGPSKRVPLLELPRTVWSELDPLGALLELHDDLQLTDRQVEGLVSIRRELRRANRPGLERLDSLDGALRGRLGVLLAVARGEETSPRQRRWWPKVPAAEHALVTALLGCVRATAGGAKREAIALLDDDQRRALDALARRSPAAAAIRGASDGRADWREPSPTPLCSPAGR